MRRQSKLSFLLLTASITLSACQTAETTSQHENIRTMKAEIDSDGDGVLDVIDECPETPLHTVVDARGCLIEVYTSGLEMEFNGFFPPMSSQLPAIYNEDFITMVKSLNEYPKANVFIFGHVAANEINQDSLARNRALIVKNTLASQHGIDAKRMRTYDCSNNIFVENTDNIDRNFKALNNESIESKQSRVTLKASSSVQDLTNLEYDYYIEIYGEYAKYCERFES
ncbi:OmpA family protein [uncultured Psychrobacter sp.]|uniref:OmpA family protein n=1 Tax=uncultured Psychrobacter sp. TaxID=259303 RepID=UPI00262DCBA6|nr:OmpA family protein [uncultured Psychrobacter sp.]